jgi:hypothetical protein
MNAPINANNKEQPMALLTTIPTTNARIAQTITLLDIIISSMAWLA